MRCDPADAIIKKFNGLKAVADIVEVTPHTVMRWRRPKEEGGTGGIIPHWHIEKLLDAARERKIDLAPNEFLPDFGLTSERAA
jgi:hypothetical protein